MSRHRQQTALIFTLPLLSSIAFSQQEPEHQSLGAHVHGKAELTIAIEDTSVEMQFISPAANIFGFEHAPASTEQKQQIQRAEVILSAVDTLFEFEGTSCQSIDQTLDLPFADELSETGHEQHAEENHEHEHKHKHQHSDDQHSDDQHSDDQHSDHQNEHVEVVVSYRFECDGRAPTGLRALLLGQFPAIESLDAQWITDTKQGAQALTIDQPKIDLR